MPGKAAKIKVSEKQYAILQQIAGSTHGAAHLIQRAKIILLAFGGMLNMAIGEEVGLHRQPVGIWRRRWADSWQALIAIECGENPATLRRAIEDTLSDAPRSGAPVKFTAQQVTQVLAVACEPPELSERPINSWTQRELADELVKRKVVPSISFSTIGRYLREADLQPHRCKYWLNSKEKDRELFQQQVELVCDTYLAAPDLFLRHNTHTVSIDEMPGLQALQQIAEKILMQPGQPERIEYEYKRNGTVCLTGNWHVVLGQMISPTIGETRTEADFAQHIHNLVRTDREASWVLVMDNLNTHCSASLVSYIANLEGYDDELLGLKGKSGFLKSMATRQAFLSDPAHRIRIVYTPKHSSWLNQIEIVFGIIHRRAVARGSFASQEELKERLRSFIDYYNQTFARPFNWTYTGRPVKAAAKPRPRTWRESWAKSRETKQPFAMVA